MFRRVQRVLVALSGGADSTACLLVLRALGAELGFTVVACHFDHQLREGSKSDIDSVREQCHRLEIECVTGEGDVAGVAAQMKRGIEDTAREMRYQFLAFVAEKEGADCVATGHTADDQAETVLMRIVRGSGIRGIRGMLPVSGVPGSEAQRLVRPLLETRRDATEAICAEWGIEPLIDASNADVQFTRNRLRHETLPALETINPAVRDALIGLAESAREAFEPLGKKSFEVQPTERGPVGAIFDLAALAALPTEAIGLVIEREAAFYHLEPEANRTQLQNLRAVLQSGSGEVEFRDTCVEASCGVVRVGPLLDEAAPIETKILDVPGSTKAGAWRIEVRTDPLESTAEAPVAALDASQVKGAVRVRSLAPGDRIRWHGMERKVSDVLINEKVPAWERLSMVAIADSDGILALFGAHRTFARDGGEAGLWLRVSALPNP